MNITELLNSLTFQQTKRYDLQSGTPAHVILDLETMGTGADAAVVAIGAVALDATYNLCGYFHAPLNLDDVLKYGCTVTAGTIQWWMGQTTAAQEALDLEEGMLLANALDYFTNWITRYGSGRKITTLWGNGPEFDNALLANLYVKAGKKIPWDHWVSQSIRTLRQLDYDMSWQIPRPEPIIPHIAVFDAWAEAQYLQTFYSWMRRFVRLEKVSVDTGEETPTQTAMRELFDGVVEQESPAVLVTKSGPWANAELAEQRAKEYNDFKAGRREDLPE